MSEPKGEYEIRLKATNHKTGEIRFVQLRLATAQLCYELQRRFQEMRVPPLLVEGFLPFWQKVCEGKMIAIYWEKIPGGGHSAIRFWVTGPDDLLTDPAKPKGRT